MNRVELLAPAGDNEKLKVAINFGANAVYMAGKNYGLRAFATNFEDENIADAVSYAHERNVKVYITLNIFAKNSDFDNIDEYLKLLVKANVDAVIISDLGLISYVHEKAPELVIHVSTQANTTNKYSALAYAKMGAKRIILARELSLPEIKEIHDFLPKDVEIETFVHGAMCISYSGRCLLSTYLTGRDSNRGACAQACRWEYSLEKSDNCSSCGYSVCEKTRPNEKLDIQEDSRGSYIFNSKDMCMIEHLKELKDAGITSFKIEGRMKSPYYVATITNAYRRALDEIEIEHKKTISKELVSELEKTSHRKYTTGFMIDVGDNKQNYETANQFQSMDFVAIVRAIDEPNGRIKVEQRNRFKVGETLEVLSPNSIFNSKLVIEKMENMKGEEITDAKRVQEELYIYTKDAKKFAVDDILRK
ncbi:MAG: U32 family peptidase [Clostridia bacterium]